MNIGYITYPMNYPPKAGGEIHSYYHTRELSRLGHKVFFLGNSNISHWIPYSPDIGGIRKFMGESDVLYIRIDGEVRNEKYSLLKDASPDLPVVWEVNAPLTELLLRGHTKEFYEEKHRERVRYASNVSLAVCVSDEMQSYAMLELGIDNTIVIPNGAVPITEIEYCDKKSFPNRLLPYKEKFKVLWAGSPMYPWQDIQGMLSAAGKLGVIDKEYCFIFIGDFSGINLGNIPDNVVILDEMDHDTLSDYILAADVCLCIYNDLPNKEFFFSPLKLFDYMGKGKAVIASRLGQIKKVINHGVNGLLVDDERDIISTLLRLKYNRDELDILGKNARKDVIHYYNWRRAAEETVSAISSKIKLNAAKSIDMRKLEDVWSKLEKDFENKSIKTKYLKRLAGRIKTLFGGSLI